MKPFLKWAGGKYKLVPKIRAALPQGVRLVEPFVGSGSVFLNLDYPEYLLGDTNQDLIHLYQVLKNNGVHFIDYCRTFFDCPNANTSEHYYENRRIFNSTEDSTLKSALFVYLNRHGYNGLCRYNQSGGFNVPFGKYASIYFPHDEMLNFVSRAKNAEFHHLGFTEMMKLCGAGDVVYCDPPYAPLQEQGSNFTTYSAGGFTEEDQRTLATLARELSSRGVPVLISNHDTELTNEIYAESRIARFSVQRNISSDGTNRKAALELLALFKAVKEG